MQCEYSINLTVHNRDFLLERTLKSIKDFTVGDYELVIVLDGCVDNSERICKEWEPQFSHFKLLYANDIYETLSNNLSMKNSNSEYIIIVQDDMVITELGWNERLSIPIKIFDDVFAVSARATHNFHINPNSQEIHSKVYNPSRWADILIAYDPAGVSQNTPRNKFVIRNSCIRGPLLLRNDIVTKLNYLDEDFAPGDLDDHELCYRAYKQLGMKCGVFTIGFLHKHEWGATRRPNDINGLPREWVLKSHFKNSHLMVQRYYDLLTSNHNEERTID